MWSSAGLLCAALALVTPATAPGSTPSTHAEGNPEGNEEPPAGAEPSRDLSGASPVNLIPKVEIRHQLVAPDSGGHAHATTIRMDIMFFRRALLRYAVPLVTVGQAGVQRTGIGDIQVDSLTAVSAGPRHVAILAAGLVLNTATQPALGSGKQVVDVGVAGAIKPRSWWLVYAIAEQQLSFAGDETRADVNRLLTRLGTIVFGRERDWYLLDLAPQVDFEDGGRARLFGAIETGRLLSGRRVGLFIRAGTQLLGQRQLDYTVGAGFRYLFQLTQP